MQLQLQSVVVVVVVAVVVAIVAVVVALVAVDHLQLTLNRLALRQFGKRATAADTRIA